MEIVIEHSQTKRLINGNFNICGSRSDLIELARQITEQTKNDFHYGWIQIHKKQRTLIDTKPMGWDEKGNEDGD